MWNRFRKKKHKNKIHENPLIATGKMREVKHPKLEQAMLEAEIFCAQFEDVQK